MLQPVKEMTPAASLCEQPASVAPDAPVPFVMARLTVDVSAVTVLPPASSTVSWGCVPNAVPPVALPGWVVNDSWDGGADRDGEGTAGRWTPGSEAVGRGEGVGAVLSCTLQPENETTP